jgi:hypothetical protein
MHTGTFLLEDKSRILPLKAVLFSQLGLLRFFPSLHEFSIIMHTIECTISTGHFLVLVQGSLKLYGRCFTNIEHLGTQLKCDLYNLKFIFP